MCSYIGTLSETTNNYRPTNKRRWKNIQYINLTQPTNRYTNPNKF